MNYLTSKELGFKMVIKMGEVCEPISYLREGGVLMATSTILEKIRVNNPKVIEEYVAAMEASANTPIETRKPTAAKQVTDPAELKKIMLRGIEKWGKK